MKRPPGRVASTEGEGFTLVEVAVVLAIIGILAGIALVFIKPRSFAATPRGYADEVAALADAVRQRAVASRTFQMLEVEADRVVHKQADKAGLIDPADADFDSIGVLPVPSEVVIAAVDSITHVMPNTGVPSSGAGIPAEILFSPDGSAEAATIFVEDVKSANRARVAVYRATGSAYVYYEW